MTERIYSLKNGPISVQILANQKGLVLFSRRRQNEVIRNALNAAGQFWADVFLPKRFTNYAKSVLGFNPSHQWMAAKEALVSSTDGTKKAIAPQPLPLVYRGEMRTSALTRWRAASVVTAKKQTLIIRIPLGHAVKAHIAKIITRVPQIELQRIVDVFAKVLPQQISAEGYGPQQKQPKPRGLAKPRAGGVVGSKGGRFSPVRAKVKNGRLVAA